MLSKKSKQVRMGIKNTKEDIIIYVLFFAYYGEIAVFMGKERKVCKKRKRGEVVWKKISK